MVVLAVRGRLYLSGPAREPERHVAAIHRALLRFRLNFRPHKCAAHLPSFHEAGAPPSMSDFLSTRWGVPETAPYDATGIVILGTEACADRATALYTRRQE